MKIPCTVAILTRNSAATLERALEGVRDLSDILICDGGSTDETLAIAARFGARVVPQDRAFLYDDGRIADYSGVRNQCLAAAHEEWFFYIDSDEYVGPDLVAEIIATTREAPAAYWVPRRYVWNGTVIECSTGYPNQQMRLFHKSVVTHFIKRVHERIETTAGAPVQRLTRYMYVPVDDDIEGVKEKWHRYIQLEEERQPRIRFSRALYHLAREGAIGIRFFLRWLLLFACPGARMPMKNELMRVWYQYQLLRSVLRRISL